MQNENYLRWHVKRLLITYFIGSISAEKYQNPFTCVKVIASQRWDVLRHGVLANPMLYTAQRGAGPLCMRNL